MSSEGPFKKLIITMAFAQTLGMGTILIPSIDTCKLGLSIDTCKLGLSIDTCKLGLSIDTCKLGLSIDTSTRYR